MPTARQQRAARNRRITTPQAPQVIPTLGATITSIGGGLVEMQFLSIALPPALGGTPLPIVLTGLPQFQRVLDSGFPTSATLNPDGLTVQMSFAGAPMTTADSFWIGNADPAVRTPTGGYVGAGLISLPATLPPPLAPATFTATQTGANDVTIVVTPSGGNFLLCHPTQWRYLPGSIFPTSALWIGSTGVLTFPSPVTPGDTVNFDGPTLSIGSNNACTPSLTPVVIV